MKKWRIDYAYRKDGKYCEGEIFLEAMTIDEALGKANSALLAEGLEGGWDATDKIASYNGFTVWNIGIMADADDEVC